MSKNLNQSNTKRMEKLKLVGEAFGWMITPLIGLVAIYVTYQGWFLPFQDESKRATSEKYRSENAVRASLIVDLKLGMAATCRIQFDDPAQIQFAYRWGKATGREGSIVREVALSNMLSLTKDEQELLALTYDAESLMHHAFQEYAQNTDNENSAEFLARFKKYQNNYKSIMRRTLSIMHTTHQVVQTTNKILASDQMIPAPDYNLNANMTPDYCPEEAEKYGLRPIGDPQ
jgi:hypothetical protein